MGIPKFYRWISERYPCLSEIVKEYQIPEFENLFLDMNGIIHTCSHPDDNNPHFRITEQDIFSNIFHYIEVLFRMIKPLKVFFMAIDGVAPRAKMNQQRSRRFRSAKEVEDVIAKAMNKGEDLPKEDRFDSNCITPGTAFMARLHVALKDFIISKVNSDPLWQIPTIIFSGHESPGEGEHKIMDFIRHEKSKPTFNANTRHCLYGLDADLIMLGMLTHEPHFALLREEVKFTKSKSDKRVTSPEDTTFHLLHLSLLRDYLNLEFSSLKGQLDFRYDLEKIIDDWVFMGFLVGNDFVPNLPNIHIHHDCLPVLWSAYKRVLPTLKGYINEGGLLNLTRFHHYITELEKYDLEKFQEHAEDIRWMKNKSRNGRSGNKISHKKVQNSKVEEVEGEGGGDDDDESDEVTNEETSSDEKKSLSSDLLGIPSASDYITTKSSGTISGNPTEVDSSERMSKETTYSLSNEDSALSKMFRDFKDEYYKEKMELPFVDRSVLEELAYEYVLALQWILHYYYNGVQSWSWFYPSHYAPFLSDLRYFRGFQLKYDLSKPLLPFQQLMAVLPKASKKLLPSCYHSLMEEGSILASFYPLEFKTDLNGKLQEWEAVVLIPFIDEQKLLEAMEKCDGKLSAEEKKRNSFGPHIVVQYTAEVQKSYHLQNKEVLHKNHAKVKELPIDAFHVLTKDIHRGLCKGVDMTAYRFGFPTLQHLPHKGTLKVCGVRVFQRSSTNASMALSLERRHHDNLEMVAKKFLGHVVHVNYPHLIECLVTSVSSDEFRWRLSGGGEVGISSGSIVRESLIPDEQALWQNAKQNLIEKYMTRYAVDIGDEQILIYGRLLVGKRYVVDKGGHVSVSRQWSKFSEPFLHQTTVLIDSEAWDSADQSGMTLSDLFPVGSCIFMLCNPHYGAQGLVTELPSRSNVRVTAKFTIPTEPNLHLVRRDSQMMNYAPAHFVCPRLGIPTQLLARITGTVYVVDDVSNNKTNIGLNLKYNKQNLEVPGYTKKVENEWLYSQNVCNILKEYIAKFPDLFKEIARMSNNDVFPLSKVFKQDREKRMEELRSFLDELPCRSISAKPHGTLQLESQLVECVKDLVDSLDRKKQLSVVMQVKPHLLYQLKDLHSTCQPDEQATFELLDRVVNVRQGYCVPVGLRGTIVGVQPGPKVQDYIYEVLFDRTFAGGIRIKSVEGRGYKVPSSALINITHGERMLSTSQGTLQKNSGVNASRPHLKNSSANNSASLQNANNSSSQGVQAQKNQGSDEFEKIWKSLKALNMKSAENRSQQSSSTQWHPSNVINSSLSSVSSASTSSTSSAGQPAQSSLSAWPIDSGGQRSTLHGTNPSNNLTHQPNQRNPASFHNNMSSLPPSTSSSLLSSTTTTSPQSSTTTTSLTSSSSVCNVPTPPTMRPPQEWINQTSHKQIHVNNVQNTTQITMADLLKVAGPKGYVALDHEVSILNIAPTTTTITSKTAATSTTVTQQSCPKKKELHEMCQQLNLFAPQIDVFFMSPDSYKAQVLLSNGRHFYGSIAKNPVTALESVCGVALYNMKSDYLGSGPFSKRNEWQNEPAQKRDNVCNFVPTQVLRNNMKESSSKEIACSDAHFEPSVLTLEKFESSSAPTSEKFESSSAPNLDKFESSSAPNLDKFEAHAAVVSGKFEQNETHSRTADVKFVNKKHKKRIAANFEDYYAGM